MELTRIFISLLLTVVVSLLRVIIKHLHNFVDLFAHIVLLKECIDVRQKKNIVVKNVAS